MGLTIPEPPALLRDIASLRSTIPKEFSECDFGCSFDFVLLDCSGRSVRYLAVGNFPVLLFDGTELRTLFQPNTLRWEMIKQGAPSDAASRFKFVGTGPWIMDEALDLEMSEEVALGPGQCVLVTTLPLAEQLDVAIVRRAPSSKKPATALRQSLGKNWSIVTVTG